ncbi:MAG: hypothetical protein AAFR26_02895, partial [Cyanobacteria bacterium J06626_4]
LFDRAIQVAQKIFDEFDKALALRSINITAILNSKHEQVANVILASSLGWQRDFVLSDTAGTYAYHLQAERAISLVGQILYPSQRVCALQGVFNCFVRRKADLEHWFGLLKEVESFVIAETHLSVKAQALRIMAGHRTQLNQFDHASSLLEEARQLAEGISLDEPDKSVCHEAVLNDIAHVWGELNRHMTHQSDDRAVAERAQTAEAVEETLAGDNAHIANLQRVLRVQSWIQQGSIEEALAIAEQITEASLKDLALRLAGVSPKAEYLDDVVQDLQKVCVSASQQDDADTGLAILQQVMTQLPTLENCIIRPTVDSSKDFRSAYKASLLVSVVEAYFQLANTDV